MSSKGQLERSLDHGRSHHCRFGCHLPVWAPPTDVGRHDLAKHRQRAGKGLGERIAKNIAKQAGKRKDPTKIQVSLTDPFAPLGRDKKKVFRLDLRGCADRGIELLAPVQANSFMEKNSRRRTDKSRVTNSVSMMHGILISALPVTSCRTQVGDESNVMGAVTMGVSLSVRSGHLPKLSTRARTETGLLVLAQNLMRLDRLNRDAINSPYTLT